MYLFSGRFSLDNLCRKRRTYYRQRMGSGRFFLIDYQLPQLKMSSICVLTRNIKSVRVNQLLRKSQPTKVKIYCIPRHVFSSCYSLSIHSEWSALFKPCQYSLQVPILSMAFSSKGGGSAPGKGISDTEDSPIKGKKRGRKRAISDSDEETR